MKLKTNKLPKSLKQLFSISIIGATTALTSEAAVSITGNIATAGGSGTITISEDITFTATTTGTIASVAFDEWVISDGTFSAIGATGFTLTNLTTGTFVDSTAFFDNFTGTNDGGLLFNGSLAASAGDIFTLSAGTSTIAGNGTFNPLLVDSTFSGNAFLGTNTGAALSDLTAVPEPSAVFLLSAGLGLTLLRRNRCS